MSEENLPSANPFGEVEVSVPRTAGELSMQTREQSELQAAVFNAKRFKRNEAECYEKIMNACNREGLAKDAEYSFPRGKGQVTGASIVLVRELKRCWGNIRTGIRVIENTDKDMHIKGYAWDLETGAYEEFEDKFPKKVLRAGNKWEDTKDERSLRELMFRRGAILVRNAVLCLIPRDVVDHARERCHQTLLKKADGKLSRNRDDVVRSLVVEFKSLGVSIDMIERMLGHALAEINRDEVVELGRIYNAIKDGQATRDEFFEFTGAGSESDLADELSGDKKKKKNKQTTIDGEE